MDKVRNRRMLKRYRQIWPLNVLGQEVLDKQYRYLLVEHQARDVRRRVLQAFINSAGITLLEVASASDDELSDMMADLLKNPYLPGAFGNKGVGDWPRCDDGMIDLMEMVRLARGIVRMDSWENHAR